jgi:Cu2+-containing amine oxidase
MKSLSALVAILLLAQTSTRPQPTTAVHPLEPLSASDITATTAALTSAGRLRPTVTVVTIELSEPEKSQLTRPRAARAVLYDWPAATTTEQTVDLQTHAVSAATTVATGDPPIRRVVIDRANEIALGDNACCRCWRAPV